MVGLAPPPCPLPHRKPLGFQDLGSHLEKLLSEGETAEDNKGENHNVSSDAANTKHLLSLF